MKYIILALTIFSSYFLSVQPAFAQTVITPTPTEVINRETDTPASGSGALSAFISGFDWIATGLIFNTPSLLDDTIKLSDGTELSGLSQYRNIFYDIATPLFVLILSFIALSHITHDNTAQLKNFFQRLIFIIVLFIVTPAVLSYSIQFTNLLNDKINAQNTTNFVTFITNYINSGDFNQFLQSVSVPSAPLNLLFSPQSLMQLVIFLIAIGFFLIGFLYIVFQFIIRFIALLLLSVLFPLVLPFALSERTENITNTYFRMWFTFLIQQPAFVLGFAIVSSILGSILQAHGGSLGTLFLFSGSFIFLGGVNIFVGRIFGEGWSLVTANAQSMIGSRAIHNTINEVKSGAVTGRVVGARSYAGKFLGQTFGLLPVKKIDNNVDNKQDKSPIMKNKRYELAGRPEYIKDQIIHPYTKAKLIKEYSKKKK